MPESKKRQNRRWFDYWSQTYDKFIFKRFMWHWQDKTIAELPHSSKSILEVACGTGVGTQKTAQKFPRAQIHAIDLSKGMIERAKERLKSKRRVHVSIGDVERLPFKNKFDAVFCTESFHHFPNPKKAIAEMSKATKKGGTIVITDINFPPLFLSNIIFRLEPGFVHMYSRTEFKQLFENAGLEIVKQKRVGLFALMTVGKKTNQS